MKETESDMYGEHKNIHWRNAIQHDDMSRENSDARLETDEYSQ